MPIKLTIIFLISFLELIVSQNQNELIINHIKIGKFKSQYSYFNNSEINKVIIWPGEFGFNKMIKILNNMTLKKDYLILSFKVNDWDNELSPWELKSIKNEYFKGEGPKTLNYIKNEFLPYFEKKFPEIKNKPKIIGGYSLSGLFSLYAFYSTNLFIGVGGFSPSLWFENWFKFINENKIKNNESYIYLSLGDVEEKNNEGDLSIGCKVKDFFEIIVTNKNVKDCAYEINEGNHFDNVENRIAKGFAWLLGKF